MRRVVLIVVMLVAVVGAAASAAQASVMSLGAAGEFGVSLIPTQRTASPVTTGSCPDPWLSSDLAPPPAAGLCWHGGAVMHRNETFALTWDGGSSHSYWESTRGYVEQFLRDVADGSGRLSSPYALATQYSDTGGHAGNASAFGGGCIDYSGSSSCQYGTSSTTTFPFGDAYPSTSNCTPTGWDHFHEASSGAFDSIDLNTVPNTVCLTDADVRGELATMITNTNMLTHVSPGYTPLVVLLTPPGVETCLDGTGTVCSANGGSTQQFCSYHSQVDVGGTLVSYVVQPWTALTGCDEPDAPPIHPPIDVATLARYVGIRLVSPLSQSQLAAITNPGLNGWFAQNGSEIDDNGCVPFGNSLDTVTVGNSSQNPYLLQREFNNAGLIQVDPNSLKCAPNVMLSPTFVVPSAVRPGDEVQFDGSTTVSTLIVPHANYLWSFGDGTTAIGPSVVHTYAAGGAYAVKLTVTDRGGNVAVVTQTINVLGPTGQPVAPPSSHPNPGLQVRMQLMPQGLRAMLRNGIAVRVRSNQSAAGIVTLRVSRGLARRAHIHAGGRGSVVVGRGTVSGIHNGTAQFHLRLSRAMAKKLGRLHHLTITVSLALVGAGRNHVTIDAAGSY